MNSSQHPTGGSNPFRNGAPSFEKALGAFFRPMRKVELPEPPAGRKVYLSADHHLFHTNILKHCPERGRLFRTVEEMNASFLDLHNRTVGRDDVVIFVGDYLWKGRGGNPEYDNSPAGRFREMKSLTGKLNGKNTSSGATMTSSRTRNTWRPALRAAGVMPFSPPEGRT